MGELYDNSHLDHVTVIRSSMHDNPTVSEDAKRDALQGLTEEEREARVEGRYVHFGGLVYPEFGGKHLVPEPEFAHIKQLDCIVGIDPGLTGTGVVWVGFDKDDHAVAFDELFLKDATPDVVAPGIREVNARWGLEPDHYVIDPSARNRDLINAEQLEAAYARAGIYTMPGQNAREPGITQVKRRLQADPPALLVSEACQRLRWEFVRYRRQEKPDGSFDVLKQDDHELDALRYCLMERAWGVMEDYKPPKKQAHWNPKEGHVPAFKDVPADDYEMIESAGPMGAWG
jgi:hypothetical protein